ncbi:hypothetical protein H4R35_006137, partial [Dimargaris xerosporica]
GHNVVVDRCNFDEEQRKPFIIAGDALNCPVDALFFDVSAKVCQDRVLERSGHPTGVEGRFGVGVVTKFASVLSPPSTYEGFRHVHHVSPHLPPLAYVDDVYHHRTIAKLLSLFPARGPSTALASVSSFRRQGGNDKKSEDEKKKKEELVAKHFSHHHHHPHHVRFDHTMGSPSPPPSPLGNISVVAKPVEGKGTYKESKGVWEDENKNKHYTHDLYNEHVEQEADGQRHLSRHTRHLQNSDHIHNPTTGFQRAFDHLSLSRNQEGHQLEKSGKKTHFSDNAHFYHQSEHEEDAKKGTLRSYEHKHVNNYRHIHSDKPEKARTEGFEHRSFNYAYRGQAFDPSCVMDESYKGKSGYGDKIKASFANMPDQEHYSFGQKISWKGGLPPGPRMPPTSFMHDPKK